LNALIPRDSKNPKGEWRSQVAACGTVRREPQRARSDEAAAVDPGVAPSGQKRLWSRRAERAVRAAREKTRRIRPGTLTPEWQPSRGGGRCGRAKGRCERTAPIERKRAASQEALIQLLEKPAAGEPSGETSSTFNCGVRGRGMPAADKVGNQITWNLFLFGPRRHVAPLKAAPTSRARNGL